MQPIKQLTQVLAGLADAEHCLFALHELRAVLPDHGPGAFKAVINRAERSGLLRRVCRGLYLHVASGVAGGLLLYHAAARLRAGQFNYISLESALSDAGVISQVPMNWVTVMSSGRSQRISCGDFGTIEFVHTRKQPAALANRLDYDARCHLWRASIALAIQDMKATGRNMDLIDWEAANVTV